MRVIAGVAAALLLAVGCEYGPEHLDAFYRERDRWQALIDGVEARHHLPSRDTARREAAERALDERADEERRFAEWLASLTPEQRFEWMKLREELAAKERMHQAEMEALERNFGERVEVHHHHD
jgi:hypothetical protein